MVGFPIPSFQGGVLGYGKQGLIINFEMPVLVLGSLKSSNVEPGWIFQAVFECCYQLEGTIGDRLINSCPCPGVVDVKLDIVLGAPEESRLL